DGARMRLSRENIVWLCRETAWVNLPRYGGWFQKNATELRAGRRRPARDGETVVQSSIAARFGPGCYTLAGAVRRECNILGVRLRPPEYPGWISWMAFRR